MSAILALTPPGAPTLLQVLVGENIYTTESGVVADFQNEIAGAILAKFRNALGAVPTPAAPTVAQIPGAVIGLTTYSYAVVAFAASGNFAAMADTLQSPAGTIATGNAALSGANGNRITFTTPTMNYPATVVGFKVIRTAGGPSQGLVGTVYAGNPLRFDDTGQAATAYTQAGSNPTVVNAFFTTGL